MATALLERDSELEQLDERIEAALAGEGSTVAVEGPAGIGKSALLGETTRLGRSRGMQVLQARGGELEAEFAYGVVRQLVEREVTTSPPERRERLLSGAARFAAPALGLAGTNLPAAAETHAVLHGLYWLAANLAAERPLLLVLDDAHWADPASVRFASYLARRAPELPLLVVYAARTGEAARTGLPAATEPGLVRAQLRLLPLSERATAELLGRQLDGDPRGDLALACHTASGGNPFLLSELVRELRAEGSAGSDGDAARHIASLAPASIARATLSRLERLGRAATELAFALAVMGTGARLRHVVELAGMTPAAGADAADALARAAIVDAHPALEFAHPIVRTAVYAEIAPGRRATSHRRAAEMLARDGALPEAFAPHLLACEPSGDAWVVEQLRAAARAVGRRGAPDAARVHLRRAQAEPPAPADRAAVLLELGAAELRAGHTEAIEHLRRALADADATAVRIEAAEELTLALTATDRGPEAVEMLDATIARIADVDREAGLRLDAQLICIAQVDSATATVAHERLARYDGALNGGSAGERLLLANLAFDTATRGDRETAVRLAELALADGRLLTEQRPDSPSFYLAALTLAYADRLEPAERLCDEALHDARARGSLLGFAISIACRSIVLARQGRIAETEAEIRTALETSVAEGWPVGSAFAVASALEALIERDTFAACEALLRDTGTSGELPTSIMASTLLHGRGHLRLAAGDARAALVDFEEIRRRDAGAGLVNPGAYNANASAALAHARLGERDAALELSGQGLTAARRWGAPSAISFALRARAVAEGDEGGIEPLREAASVTERSPARYERARALTALGAALRRAGHRRDARVPLRQALDLAQRCGALRLASEARDELVASGARPRRAALTGSDALTACERRIVRLAADGLSNRDIAQALFVTVRTVEGHLTHAYRKLGIGSREGLAQALQDPASGSAEPRERPEPLPAPGR